MIFLHLNNLPNFSSLVNANAKNGTQPIWLQNLFRAQDSMCFIMTLSCFSCIRRIYLSNPLTEGYSHVLFLFPLISLAQLCTWFQSWNESLQSFYWPFTACLGQWSLSHILNLTVIRKLLIPKHASSLHFCHILFQWFQVIFLTSFSVIQLDVLMLVISGLFLQDTMLVEVPLLPLYLSDELPLFSIALNPMSSHL